MATEKEQVGDDVNTDFPDGLAELRAGARPGTWIGHDQNQKTVETLNAFVPTQTFQGMPDVKWGLTYTTNTADAFKAAKEQFLILAVGTGVVAIVVGILVSYWQNEPLDRSGLLPKPLNKLGRAI